MTDFLYETDKFAWYLRETALLQRLAESDAGVRSGIDWQHVLKEFEQAGRVELTMATLTLQYALEEMAQAALNPDPESLRRQLRTVEIRLDTAAAYYRPSMKDHFQLDEIWRQAFRQVRRDRGEAEATVPLPEGCPFTLEDLVERRFNAQLVLQRLRPAAD